MAEQTVPETKTCTKCHAPKPVSEFHKKLNGYTAHCRPCGCAYAKERRPNLPHKRERTSWYAAKARCENPNDPAYARYGWRGIRMCDEWRNSFDAFLRDMGPRPAGHDIDRIDNDGHYEPGNCRWATRLQQNNNQCKNVRVEVSGKVQSAAEWALAVGKRPTTVRARLRKGWTPERAIGQPIGPYATPHLLTHDGVTLTLTEWAHRVGLKPVTLGSRIRAGWPVQRALTAPADVAANVSFTKRRQHS